MSIKQQFFISLPLILTSILGVKVFSMRISYAAPNSQTPNQILEQKTDKFLLAAVTTCEVSMPTPEINERLVLNVREVPNGNMVGTVDDGETVELETPSNIESLYWVKIIDPVVGYVWTEYLTNCQ